MDIKSFYEKYENSIYLLMLVLITTICSFFFKGHYSNILTDFGREMYFPEVMQQGNVLYRDILCIYFPFAFQLNSFAYKIFGVSLSTIEACGILNLTIYTIAIYLLSKEFFDNKLSFLFALTINMASGYNGTLFNFILPYSYSLTYGISAIILSVFFLIKYIKTDYLRYLMLSSFLTGFAFACKGEFLAQLVVIFLVMFFYKKNNNSNYIKIFLSFLIIPVFSLIVLFRQGMSILDFFNAISFMKTFFSTPSMLYHIGRTGGIFSISDFSLYIQGFIYFGIFISIIFCLFYLIQKKGNNNLFLLSIVILIGAYSLNNTKLWLHTILLPIVIFLMTILFFKRLKNNLPLLIISLSSIAITLRMFWSLIISTYGIFTLALPVLTLLVFLREVVENRSKKNKNFLYKFYIIFLSCYLVFYGFYNIVQRNTNDTKIKTNKGEVYLPEKEATALNKAIDECNKSEIKKVLFLPEGTFINFMTNREVDLKMFMVDRLYYEAIGNSQIVNNLQKNKYDMIFIAEGFGLTNFGKPYLYGTKNEILDYIFENYNLKWVESFDKKQKKNYLYCLIRK
jgi:hypothetical protein